MTVNLLSQAIERVIVTLFVNLASNLRNGITPYVVHLNEQLRARLVGIRSQSLTSAGPQRRQSTRKRKPPERLMYY